jgi:hypothetical protein
MEIIDSNGQVVSGLVAYAGRPAVTTQVYLAAGTYTVRYSASAPNGSELLPTQFTLSGREISDPIGPTSTLTGGSRNTTNTDTWTGSSITMGTVVYIPPLY